MNAGTSIPKWKDESTNLQRTETKKDWCSVQFFFEKRPKTRILGITGRVKPDGEKVIKEGVLNQGATQKRGAVPATQPQKGCWGVGLGETDIPNQLSG